MIKDHNHSHNRIFKNGQSNGNGNKQTRVRPHTKEAANLESYAKQVLLEIGPVICIDRDWWRWNGSIWKMVNSAKFLPYAFGIQKEPRSNKMAANIIDTIRMISQRDPDETPWRGAIGFKDKETIIINVQNGVVRVGIETGGIELIDPDPAHYATIQMPVSYQPKAECPVFHTLLESALPDAADRFLLQCYAGYCLLPDTRFQCVLQCHGKPNSGKSLLILHGIGSVFGQELMSHVSLEKICEGGDELRHLEQSLVNIGSEIDQGELRDSALFNKLACAEGLDAALKYDKSRRIKPTCKHIYIGNNLPRWKRGSDAQARRIKILHFPNDFSRKPKDGNLEREVELEGNGIFNWMLQGLLKLVKREQMPLGSRLSQTHYHKFKSQNNPIEEFNRRYCEFGSAYRMLSKAYIASIMQWAEREDISVKGNIIELLRKLHPEITKHRGQVYGEKGYVLTGIMMTEPVEE